MKTITIALLAVIIFLLVFSIALQLSNSGIITGMTVAEEDKTEKFTFSTHTVSVCDNENDKSTCHDEVIAICNGIEHRIPVNNGPDDIN